MKLRNIKYYFLLTGFLFSKSLVFSQQKPKEWDLQTCINYALQNNIQIKKNQAAVETSKVNLDQSKANRLPNLNASASELFTNQKSATGAGSVQQQLSTGNYALRSDMVLYNGLKIQNTIKQQDLGVQSGELSVKESENNIELAITTAYLTILYARETKINAENTLASSELQLNQAKIMYDAGYIAESNYAQVQAQYSTDKYAVVVADNALSSQILQLKQLLELGINDSISIKFPDLDESQVMKVIPPKVAVYDTALKVMPEVKNSQLNIDMAQIDLKLAKAGALPTLSLSASAAAGYSSINSETYATQLGNNFYQNAGLSLSIPIFNNRQVKSSVSKAQIAIETAKLNQTDIEKTLLTQVETAYLNAVSAQSRFQAASEQLKATQSSYSLIEQQFNLGMKNTVDLLTEKTKFLSAQQEYLQAKYTAILNYKLLDFYQNIPITL
jgi:outer membrane protein